MIGFSKEMTFQLLGKGYVGTLASEVRGRGEEGNSRCKGPEAERRRHLGGWREATKRERHRNSRTVLEHEVGAGLPGFLGPCRHADFQLLPERHGSH